MRTKNEVQCKKKPEEDGGYYKPGDLFIDDTGETYILSSHNVIEDDDELEIAYVAICLTDGNRWEDDKLTTREAVDGLEFLGRGNIITIT